MNYVIAKDWDLRIIEAKKDINRIYHLLRHNQPYKIEYSLNNLADWKLLGYMDKEDLINHFKSDKNIELITTPGYRTKIRFIPIDHYMETTI